MKPGTGNPIALQTISSTPGHAVKLLLFLGSCIAWSCAAADQLYCSGIAEMAATYVSDRERGQSYATTLHHIDEAIKEAVAREKLNMAEGDRYREHMHLAAQWVFIEAPTSTRSSAYQLVRKMCLDGTD